MSRSTGPILAIGAITVANQTLFHDQRLDWRVPVATAITAGMFALLEEASEPAAVGLAWVALVTILFTRTGRTPSPFETLDQFLNKK